MAGLCTDKKTNDAAIKAEAAKKGTGKCTPCKSKAYTNKTCDVKTPCTAANNAKATAEQCVACTGKFKADNKTCIPACADGQKNTTAKPCVEAGSNTMAIVGGVIGGLVVVGLLAYFFMGKKDEERSLLDDFEQI